MISKVLKYIVMPSVVLTFNSCIVNDVPYPYIEGVIQDIQVEGMISDPVYNTTNHTVEITIGEDAFLDSLPVTRLIANDEALIYPDTSVCIKPTGFPNFSFSSLNELPSNANTSIDFTKPVDILLKTYQEYLWKITVTQEIERTIEVENQSGTAPLLDLYSHVAIIYVNEDADYRNIKINKLNLEGSKTELVPSPETVTDFTRPRVFKAYRNGRYICDWTVDIQKSTIPASVTEINAWATKAYIKGSFRSGKVVGVEYRVQGEEEWISLGDSSIDITGVTSYSATITGLNSATTYEVRALAGGEAGEISTFQTETVVSIPNMNFNIWSQSEDGKNWYPNADASNSYWATGNEGVTTLGSANSIPVEGADAYNGKSAKLTTVKISVAGYAAGNLLIGDYETNMSDMASSVKFGRPYNGARPVKLSGYYKYKPGTSMNPDGKIPTDRKLTVDECDIYIMLWSGSEKIAESHFVTNQTVSEYTKFELPVEYTVTTKRPDKITIVATSSRYGGEFEKSGMFEKVVGQVSAGSTLWVDEFELSYE